MYRLIGLLVALSLGAACGEGASDLISTDAGNEIAVVVDTGSPEEVALPDVMVEPELKFDFYADPGAEIPFLECLPGEGCFGDECTENADCQSGLCVEHMGEGICTTVCEDECPEGWSCKQVGAGGPDLVFACVSDHANLCRPCHTGADCKTGVSEDVCVDYAEEGAFCGGGCELVDGAGKECPWGFSCVETVTVEGVEVTQCVADAGVCPCTSKAVELALTTPCEAGNEHGICGGLRVCTEEGLSPCDAAVPAAESCNGVDDDCDGDVDEPEDVGGDYVNLCNDDNDCTKDICDGEAGCSHENLTEGECIDGDACTVGDHCENGVCAGNAVVCDDGNVCTDDACDGLGGCLFEDNSADCDDGDPCTVADECHLGVCAGVAISCDCTGDADCAGLEDGDLCNGTLFCDQAELPYKCALVPDSVVVCPEPEEGVDAICLKATCDPATGNCSLAPDHEGFACDDGDQCTIGDECAAGACAPGVPAICADGNLCTDDACDPDSGCAFYNNNLPCDDGNACTLGDHCAGGSCIADSAPECDDGNPCTVDSCDPAGGCVFQNNNAPCSDGSACTMGDTCVGGECVSGPPPDCDDGNPCTDDSCNALSGCVHLANQGVCDDGNECTQGDHCESGNCAYTQLLDCSDDDPCTDNSCDPAAGCITTLNQAPCDDQDVCTSGDHCHLGACISSGSLACDDGNPCTDDSCQPGAGCQFEPNGESCDDGNACTLDDQCANGWCLPGPAPDCDDQNLCTDDLCDPQAGCLFPNNTVPCDDSDACTVGDACAGGGCVPGEALNCADGNPCTDETCDEVEGCVYMLNNAPCTDDDACTIADTCEGGECVPGAQATCGDDNVCTDDSCDPATGCQFQPNEEVCSDDDVCTLGDVCDGGECQPGPEFLDCNDGSECTTDSCAPAAGCQYENLPEDTPCGVDGHCVAGVCAPNITGSCQVVKDNSPASPSGVYSIDPDGDGGVAPYDVYCEMGLDDGGWTMVMSINTSDGHMSLTKDAIWTVHDESGSFANRWSKDYKSRAALDVTGTALLVVVRSHDAAEGAQPVGWRSWNLDGAKQYQDFFDVSMGASNANATGGCNGGHSGDGRKQTTGILSSGVQAPYDTFTGFADNIYTNSYYGGCGPTQDAFRLSSWYRWANNSNVGLGLQMDNEGDTTYSLEAGSHMKIDTYNNPQRYCCGGCGGCQAYLDGSESNNGTKASIGSDHYNCHCSVGVSYRYEWYVR